MRWVVLVVAAFCLNCSDKPSRIDASQLEQRSDGLTYKKNAAQPFTGTARIFSPDGNPESSVQYQNGKAHGPSLQWWENGQKSIAVEFRKGEIMSKKQWDVNGNPID